MRRQFKTVAWCAVTAAMLTISASAATLQVGPGKQYSTPCKAFAATVSGDTVEIDGTGTYNGDVCGITKSNLTIRGVNGRPKIDAAGANYAGKGLWVTSGDNIVIENVELTGAKVPDRNGAGIRSEGKHLTVRNSYIHDNEDGILTSNDSTANVTIEYTEFANNGYGDGQSHNLYIGAIQSLTFRFNYSHGAKVGHLLKSRAATNYILYNRLSDEATGTASYELDLPNGGRSYVIGNLIQQGPASQNAVVLAYMEEGNGGGGTDLYVVNNTFVNQRTSGTFINVASGASSAVIKNNIFYGPGTLTNQSSAVKANNWTGTTNPGFVDLAGYNYQLTSSSPAINAGTDPGTGANYPLTPTFEYVHPTCGEGRTSVGTIDIGAYEYGGGTGGSTGSGSCVTTQELTGLVSDSATSKPIQGAKVAYSGGSTTTDSTGSYTFAGIPAGTYSVTASATGYTSATQSTTVSTGASTTLNFALKSSSTTPPPATTGTLAGHVTSAVDGHSLPGVTVSFSGRTTKTDASGNYSFTQVTPATYTVSFSSTGWLARSASVTVSSGQTVTLNMKLSTSGQLLGTVKNSYGTALSGATLKISGGVIATTLSTTSASNGSYYFGWVPVGNYTMTISKSGYTTQTKTFTVSTGATATVNVTMR